MHIGFTVIKYNVGVARALHHALLLWMTQIVTLDEQEIVDVDYYTCGTI